jgi:hypothetical protein
MKLFSCQKCQQIVFFESVACTRCGHTLAYLPDRQVVGAIEVQDPAAPITLATHWKTLAKSPGADWYRLCRNSSEHGVCNWAFPADEDGEYCFACRLTRTIPNLTVAGAKEAWHRLEIAKRRLLYTLLALELPVEIKTDERPEGMEFDFLQDTDGAPKVFTGHHDGVITINVAEADDPFREKMRIQMGETYRTVLGHFRHEIGHYYWDRLIDGSPLLEEFRALFGDERADYADAQQRHYNAGPPPNWVDNFVSSYASMHPWEDWAETWAHYLHVVDTLETARAYGLSLQPTPVTNRRRAKPVAATKLDPSSFDDLIGGWIPLTLALNSLNRSMGTLDGYPFVLSQAAIAKLRFVHDVVARARDASARGEENRAGAQETRARQPADLRPALQ